MQENAVTIDGARYRISPVFTVFATQNPVEFEGTYPLPEAQRDRFLFKINIDFPEADDEARMLDAYAAGRRLHDEAVARAAAGAHARGAAGVAPDGGARACASSRTSSATSWSS